MGGETSERRSFLLYTPPRRQEGDQWSITDRDIQAFDDLYARNRDEIDQHLYSLLREYETDARLRKLLANTVENGKRVRPMLTLTLSEMCGLAHDRAMDLCAIVEFIHNATLAADDYVDDTSVRRNAPTLWRVVERLPFVGPDELNPRTLTILAENGVLTIALQLPESTDVMNAMGEAVRCVFEGFYEEATPDDPRRDPYEEYIEVNRQKTGCLFELASRLPVVAAEHPDPVETAARDYGQRAGILYQIADDVCDGDLPSFVDDPAAELRRWHERTIEPIDRLPVTSWRERWLLATAPAWCVRRMLEQEDRMDIYPEFIYEPSTADENSCPLPFSEQFVSDDNSVV